MISVLIQTFYRNATVRIKEAGVPSEKQALLKVGQNRVVFQLCLFNCFSIISITIWLFNALMILTFYNQERCQQVTELIAQLLEDRMHLFTKAQIHTFG